jgi:alkylhydroperoxidase family enzyme
MIDYVAKLTLTPAQITTDDIQHLRHAGFDDQAILQINLIASWFNYINRVADGLGVGK